MNECFFDRSIRLRGFSITMTGFEHLFNSIFHHTDQIIDKVNQLIRPLFRENFNEVH